MCVTPLSPSESVDRTDTACCPPSREEIALARPTPSSGSVGAEKGRTRRAVAGLDSGMADGLSQMVVMRVAASAAATAIAAGQISRASRGVVDSAIAPADWIVALA